MNFLSIAALLLLTHSLSAAEKQVGQWEVFEIEMTSQSDIANPYMASSPEVRVTFTGTAGEAKSRRYTIAGFWDGAKTWKARFAPPLPGEWSYTSVSKDPGLNGLKGSLKCIAWSDAEKAQNAVRRGFIRAAGHRFEYNDGTPFLWIGDTWWNWSKRGIEFASFKKLVDDRAAKGFTIGQLFFPADNGLPDFARIQRVEAFIAYANSKGITVWIHPWWSAKDFAQKVSPEKANRWWRYVISRLAAYNVVWVLAGEYNMNNYGGMGLQFWKDLGTMIRAEDPYKRIIGTHPTPPGWTGGEDAPQWSTGEVLHKEPWLDYNQSQVGHGKWRQELIPQIIAADYARLPAKPTVVTEPWYEFISGNPSAMDLRFGAWSAMLSGAAGHTYGGGHVWWANVPESPSKQGNWPLEPGFENDTLNYPGAVSIGHMARFFKSIEWWKLEPHPELVRDYSAKFCAAIPGREYVVYLRWGGTAKIDLPKEGTFRFTWIDPSDGKARKPGTAKGGLREFRAPDDYPATPHYKDWVLHIVRTTE